MGITGTTSIRTCPGQLIQREDLTVVPITTATAINRAQDLSLEAFLALPETKPAQEYRPGFITSKPVPQGKHSTLQFELTAAINQRAKPQKLAYALPELRCTFAGRSIVPDIAVIRWHNLPRDKNGEISDRFNRPPDWIIEILSPDQSTPVVMEKIIFCLQQGTELGWLLDPQAKSVTIFQAGLPQVYFAEPDRPANTQGSSLKLIQGLDSWLLSAQDIFDWLKV
jgi:Uma2 family endonuclease